MPVVNCPKYDSTEFTDVPYLETAVVWNEEQDEITIFAVNRSLDDPLPLKCILRGFTGYQVIEHIVYESSNKKDRNTKSEPFKIVPHSSGNAQTREGIVSAVLPKLSWNVIRLTKKG